jgi:hypothetical protein
VCQGNLADRFGLYVTVGHYPAGASKWNTPERRLFSEISKRWAGEPLVDYSSVERLVRETRTTPGLTVSCLLDARRDSQGIKLIPERLKQIRPHRHSVLPPWNGPILPNQSQNQFLPAALANGFPNLEKSSHFFELAARRGSNRELLKRIGRSQREARRENRI